MQLSKRLICLLLVFAMLFSASVSSSAAKESTTGDAEDVAIVTTTTQKWTIRERVTSTTTKETTTKKTTSSTTKKDEETSSRKTLKDVIESAKATTKSSTASSTTKKSSASTTAKSNSKTTSAKKSSGTSTAKETTTKETTKRTNPFENVATMYLMVSNANPEKPHMWIYIVNNTNEKLKICDDYSIGPKGSMSMGAWNTRGTDAGGIYFNLERHWVKEATYGRTYALSTKVNRMELGLISNELKIHDYWNWVFNCGWFAVCMWNLCSPKKIVYLFWPQAIRVEMLMWGAKRPDFTIQKLNNRAYCYKYHKDGITQACYRATITNSGV